MYSRISPGLRVLLFSFLLISTIGTLWIGWHEDQLSTNELALLAGFAFMLTALVIGDLSSMPSLKGKSESPVLKKPLQTRGAGKRRRRREIAFPLAIISGLIGASLWGFVGMRIAFISDEALVVPLPLHLRAAVFVIAAVFLIGPVGVLVGFVRSFFRRP